VTAQSRETLVARDDAGSSEPRPARRAPGAARGLTAALTAVRNGIPVPAVLISVYVLCGLLAGVAALLMMGKADAGSPMAGSLAELDAIAAVIIGGASFLGGRGRVLNALTGALVIAVLRNGLNLLGIDPNWQYMATGAVIVVAVELDVLRGHLERRFRSLQAVSRP
jgi:ribose transport system permease protein